MKLLRIFTVFIIAILIAAYDTSAQVSAETETAVMKFSLAQAQEYAVQNATKAQNANLDAAISKKRTLEIITEGLPQISGSFNYQNNFKQQKSIIPAGVFSPSELEVTFINPYQSFAEINVDQLLVDGRYFLGLKANKAILSISKDQLKKTEVDIKTEVAKAYYLCLVSVETKKIKESSLKIISQSLYETEASFNLGLIEDIEVDRLKLQKNNLEYEIKNADVLLEVSTKSLKYNMGLSLDQPIELTDNLEILLTAEGVETDVSSFDPKSRIEYRLQQTQIELRSYDAKRFALGYMPGIYGNFKYGANAFSQQANVFDARWFGYGSVGLSVQVPIFDSFKKGAQYQQKKIEKTILENNLKDFDTASRLEVNKANSDYMNALAGFKNQKENLALAEKIYNKVLIKYKNGVGSSIELVQAEKTISESQGKYLAAIKDLLTAKTDLEKALGKIK